MEAAYSSLMRKLEKSKDLKNNLLNIVEISQMPIDLQEETTRQELSVAPHIWYRYDCETRGKAIAAKIISQRLELLEAFERELERNRKAAKRPPKTK